MILDQSGDLATQKYRRTKRFIVKQYIVCEGCVIGMVSPN